MSTLETINKMDESLDYAVKCAEHKKEGLEPNTEDYFRTEGEISGLNAARAMIHIIKMVAV